MLIEDDIPGETKLQRDIFMLGYEQAYKEIISNLESYMKTVPAKEFTSRYQGRTWMDFMEFTVDTVHRSLAWKKEV